MKQGKTVEGLVAGAVLQKPLGTITIDGTTYTIDRPRVATHILVSELISRLPMVRQTDNVEEQVSEALRVARDCRPILGEIAAVLVLGAKHLTEERIIENKRFFGLIKTRKNIVVDLKRELADRLLLELSPEDLKDLIVSCLHNQQLSVFFGVITSLYEVNLLKPTSEVQTIASGH